MTFLPKSISRLSLLLVTSFGLMACSSSNVASEAQTAQYKQAFIDKQLAAGYDKKTIDFFLSQGHYNQAVINAITTPWEAKPWDQYYPIFLTQKRLDAGLTFWDEYQDTIEKAAEQYQVEPEIIVAIIGIETFYGKIMGNYSVVDALYTLGFYYPPRADFFRSEFANLQDLTQEEHLDIKSLKGSYAGAMGYGQFIPSSYRHYAVDFDQDGRRDLLNSPIDAIGSVANYFHQHGWQQGAPVAIQLEQTNNKPDNLNVWAGKKPEYQVLDFIPYLPSSSNSIQNNALNPALLIELEQASGNEYWLGFNNFYVITRYNRSPLYAMAVYQFSQALKDAHTHPDRGTNL
ncbi:lytic murein transglycosylase B [Shewanella surugensis]|uniref:Lytic murein transglycosylase B n=1 Tax=Shewanella surugensis TaxID=212020 RepID=A0ABT0LC25_9GAMM|nr:lytic murein transglycosylase B [Shewanella surugensis]MCL1125195.1 lytic murein transglycosylase B [Shewanella surugensis]